MTTQDEQVEELLAAIREGIDALPTHNAIAARGLRREFSKRLAKEPPELVIALGLRLLDEPGWFYRFMSYELVAYNRPAMKLLDGPLLEKFGHGMASWWEVDTFAPLLSGPAWRVKQAPDSLIHQWAHSPDRWWRRAALVSTIGLNNKARGGKGDTARTLAVCSLLVADRDDMVVKAMSWALRELAKHDPTAVQAFLDEHQNELAARVLRETKNKLSTGLKNPRRSMV